MEYKLIFTLGYEYDDEFTMRGFRSDILLFDEPNNYYELNFITLDRIKVEFGDNRICYMDDNLVIMHEITRENVIRSIPELHKWVFHNRWIPLTNEQLEKYYYPKEEWVYLAVSI